MIKIKSNTNEFTIIFSKKIGKKKNAQKILFSLYSVQHPFFFSPSFLLVSASFLFFLLLFQRPSFRFFLLLFSAPPFFSFSSCLSFLFNSRVPFFSTQRHSFQPKTILSSAQKHFFQPKHFCPNVFQPKRFNPNVFQFFLAQMFLLQFSLSSLLLFFCFILFWFRLLFSLSVPPFFLFFSSVYPRPNILSSCFTSLLFE